MASDGAHDGQCLALLYADSHVILARSCERLQQRGGGNSSLQEKLMYQPMDQAVAIAIESYIHAPRVLSVSEVVRQVASVFPDHETAAIVSQVIKSRQSDCPADRM